ncbi:DUF1178 family protein [Rhodobacterales bacterium HKCCE3408]|nr:DUF1178 family protein [Rhodobacterales bacterium HKCCE3408]
MIRYALTCGDGHDFESWFQSASAYDELERRGLVSCAVCGSDDVRKSMMAPRVGKSAEAPAADEPTEPQPMSSGPLSRPGSEAERMLSELRAKLEANSTYVGRSFAKEARAMHLGEAPERQIHGEATADEAKSLIEDGVPVLPLPGLPKSRAN